MNKKSQKDNFEASWKSRFQDFADQFEDDAAIAGWSNYGLNSRLNFFKKIWGAHQQTEWLDLGCGAGTYSRFLAKKNFNVTAVDYSFPSLKKARMRGTENILWFAGNGKQLPLRDASYNGILCFGVMQALSSSEPLLIEMQRVLKNDGVLYFDGLNKYCLPNMLTVIKRKLKNQKDHLRYDSPLALKRQVKKLGGKNVELIWLPILPERFKKYQPWLDSKISGFIFRHITAISILFCHSFIIRTYYKK